MVVRCVGIPANLRHLVVVVLKIKEDPMAVRFLYAVTIATLITGCVTATLAPGAAQVKIVRSASDVAGCTAVGNVAPDSQRLEDPRNLTVGLGGNTFLITSEALGTILNGVAYRCP
jgi:hypothetical protein